MKTLLLILGGIGMFLLGVGSFIGFLFWAVRQKHKNGGDGWSD